MHYIQHDDLCPEVKKIKEGLERMSQSRWSGAHDDGIFCFEDELKTKDQFLAIKVTDVRFSQSEGVARLSILQHNESITHALDPPFVRTQRHRLSLGVEVVRVWQQFNQSANHRLELVNAHRHSASLRPKTGEI